MMKNVSRPAVAVIAALLCASLSQASIAQSPSKVASNSGVTFVNGASKKPKSAQQIEMETYFQSLKTPISLPDVPDIGGHGKYRFGLERTDKSGRTLIGMRYGSGSPPAQVLDFYKQGLLGSKWTLKVASDTNLQAEKAGKRLTISIMPKGSPDVATDFMVNYTYTNR